MRDEERVGKRRDAGGRDAGEREASLMDLRCSPWPAMDGNRGDSAMNRSHGRSLVRERERHQVPEILFPPIRNKFW
jgi:hypothetical protein